MVESFTTNNGLNINATQTKLARFTSGEKLRVLDLFCGCGGLSLGFQRADYDVIGGIEFNPKAAESHAVNIFKGRPELIKRHNTPVDITQITPNQYNSEVLYKDRNDAGVDVIIAGPPCQAFARIGRSKLRNLANNPKAHLEDERARLYIQLLQFVDFFQPLAVLIENVPDILNNGEKNVGEEIAASLKDLGYRCHYTILNSANYGVPQHRLRFFLIAYPDFLSIKPEFPQPTNSTNLPAGYRQVRRSAMKFITPDFFSSHNYLVLPDPDSGLPGAIGARDAIIDLPPITDHLRGELKRGEKKFDKLSRYIQNSQISDYINEHMRSWPGFENDEGVYDHVTRNLPRDIEIFRRMSPGDEYPQAHKIAFAIFHEALEEAKVRGEGVQVGSELYKQYLKKYVPPYDPEKFANKWWKLDPTKPSRTLTAHIGKDTYSHIHYDSNQARVISVREAARLQSFPDGFIFSGPMNDAFRQIGNSVPPLMSYALAKCIMGQLETIKLKPIVIYDDENV